jgi:hypothetical protein
VDPEPPAAADVAAGAEEVVGVALTVVEEGLGAMETEDEVGAGAGLLDEELTGRRETVVGAAFTAVLETLTRDGGVEKVRSEVETVVEVVLTALSEGVGAAAAAGWILTEAAAVEDAGGAGVTEVLAGTEDGTLV